jgi:hypothetical protein
MCTNPIYVCGDPAVQTAERLLSAALRAQRRRYQEEFMACRFFVPT